MINNRCDGNNRIDNVLFTIYINKGTCRALYRRGTTTIIINIVH